MDIKLIILIAVSIISFGGFILLTAMRYFRSLIHYTLGAFYFLCIFLIFCSTALINFYGAETENVLVTIMSYLFFPALLSISPLVYLYIKSFSFQKKEKTFFETYIYNFIPPFFLLIINVFAYIALNQIEVNSENSISLETALRYTNFIALFFVFLIQNIVYTFLSSKSIKDYKLNYLSNLDEINLNKATISWLWQFLISYILLFSMLYLFQLNLLSDIKVFMRIFVLLYLVWLLYKAKHHHKLLERKAHNPYLQPDQKKRLNLKLLKVMREQKIYSDPNLNLQKLAKMVDSNSKYLSKFINQEYNVNVSQFINEYRIKEAQNLLKNPQNSIYTMEYLAELTGYNSKSSFYNAFKKITGMTPTEFKQSSKS